MVFTTDGTQSNQAMLTTAYAAQIRLEPILILKRHSITDARGNFLHERLIGTQVMLADTDDYADIYARTQDMVQSLEQIPMR